MRDAKVRGWILLETMLALACVALVLSSYQRQQGVIDNRLANLLSQHRQAVQEQMSAQIENLFGQGIPIRELAQESNTPIPQCVACRSAALQGLLDYELNQW